MRIYFLTFFLLMTTIYGNEGQRSSSGLKIIHEKGVAHNVKFIRLVKFLDRELTRFFFAPPLNDRDVRLIIRRKGPVDQVKVKHQPKFTELTIGVDFVNIDDRDQHAALINALFAERFKIPHPHPLPSWIVSGLGALYQNSLSSGRVVRSVKNYRVLRGMLSSGITPSWREIVKQDWHKSSDLDNYIFSELSWALLEIFRKRSTLNKDILLPYVLGIVQHGKKNNDVWISSTLEKSLISIGNDISADDQMLKALEETAFTSYNPKGADLALEEFPLQLSSNNHNILSLPLLLKEQNPLAEILRTTIVKKLKRFRSTLNINVSICCSLLIKELERLKGGNVEDEKRALQKSIQKVYFALKREQKIEFLLYDLEQRNTSPLLLLQNERAVIKLSEEALSKKTQKFLDEIEKKYLGQ